MKDILITGIPRSGTSLLTKLLSQHDSVICFSEPQWLRDIRHSNQTAEEFSIALHVKLSKIRADIKKGNPITITVKKGSTELPDNYFKKTEKGHNNLKENKQIFFEYSSDLKIVVKSNTLFTVCLSALIKQNKWNIYSIIRDPLYTLLSWRSLDIPISRGEIKIGEAYSEKVKLIVKEPDILKRQILIYNWFLIQYDTFNTNTFKYENLILDPENVITRILNKPIKMDNILESKNGLMFYDDPDIEHLKSKIIKNIKPNKYYRTFKDSS